MEKSIEKSFVVEIVAHTGSSHRKIIKKDSQYHIYTPKKPIKGEANRDIIEMIADEFKVPKGSIELIKGEKSRVKLFKIKRIKG